MKKRKAVIIAPGTKYHICCDVAFVPQFFKYVMNDERHRKEMKLIIDQIMEGLKTKKYGNESYGTKAMKPFLNRENDRIICHVKKRSGQKQCIIMSELYLHKKSNDVKRY